MFCFARKTKIQMLTTSCRSLTRIHQCVHKSLGLRLWFSLIIFFYSPKVSYMHDGSESTQDAVIFEIELSSSRPNSLDKEMRVRQRFRLQISIRPHNDVPKIEMGPALKGKYF